jgi:two-component system alkaline phosphatase synthesis response regulator PhoP
MSAKILVIDDETDFIQLINYHLHKAGFAVLAAETGRHGLQLARKQAPDVVLLDMGLPDIDGLSVCEILRRDPITARIPIVLVTAMHGEIPRAHALSSGANHFLPKPFTRETLCDCIQKALRVRDAELVSQAGA